MPDFIIDTQLPPNLAAYLTAKGFNTIHTTFFPEGHLLQDSQIIEIAINENRIIITKDNDFLDNFILNGSPPKVLIVQLGNISNKDLLLFFENNLNEIISLFADNNLVLLNKTYIIGY